MNHEAKLATATVGELKKFIADMDESTPVFRFEVGDLKGRYEWKRKQTWKQWCKNKVDQKVLK